ncbi:5-formyltetrahydrofolate cyclo-ligase [Parafannyhessea umbonata]|uniref:5-formyltetrahydrofolate cyclo-ligase n=1 Tax=Parafannyhessea umbonata TaxID=604330 RepID=UPI00359C812A
MAAVPLDKKQLRTQLLALRRGLGPSVRAEVDARIAVAVTATEEWREAPAILTYLSVRDEVDTRELVRLAREDGKVVAAPRVTGPRSLAWYRVEAGDELEVSAMGIEEPAAREKRRVDPACLGERSVALVPGLAFDEMGYRLGYGGGFYDTFLGRFRGVSIGLCRDAALMPSLADMGALEAHDRAVGIVATETRLLR